LGEVNAAYLKSVGQGRGHDAPDDLEDEVAGLLGLVLLFADWQGIDVATVLRRKRGSYL